MVTSDETRTMSPDYLVHLHLYPAVAGALELVLGFIGMCICFFTFYQSLDSLIRIAAAGGRCFDGMVVAELTCFTWTIFGITVSVFAVVGSVCSMRRRHFQLALFSSHLATIWYCGFAILPVLYYALSSWRVSFSPFDVMLAIFVLSSLSSSALIKTSKSLFS